MLSMSILQFTNELPPNELHKRASIFDPFENSIAMRSRRFRDSTILHIIPEISGLTVGGAALAYICTIVGSGIVSLPYAL